jgi:putative lipase involved disintegration of autophagic bodies
MIEMAHTIINAVEDIKSQLQNLTPYKGETKLVVTGHSLGGALATLFSYVYKKSTTTKNSSGDVLFRELGNKSMLTISISLRF